MDFFKKFFKNNTPDAPKKLAKTKLPPAADDSDDPIERFEKTYNPAIFFASFDEAVTTLQAAGQNARAEMLLANQTTAQKALIDRVVQSAVAQGKKLSDNDKVDLLSRATDAIRKYNAKMSTEVRAYLAQQKRQTILTITHENTEEDA